MWFYPSRKNPPVVMSRYLKNSLTERLKSNPLLSLPLLPLPPQIERVDKVGSFLVEQETEEGDGLKVFGVFKLRTDTKVPVLPTEEGDEKNINET